MADVSRLRRRRRTVLGDRVNIYAGGNRDVWEAAERWADKYGYSLSAVVADALARYLADPPKPEER